MRFIHCTLLSCVVLLITRVLGQENNATTPVPRPTLDTTTPPPPSTSLPHPPATSTPTTTTAAPQTPRTTTSSATPALTPATPSPTPPVTPPTTATAMPTVTPPPTPLPSPAPSNTPQSTKQIQNDSGSGHANSFQGSKTMVKSVENNGGSKASAHSEEYTGLGPVKIMAIVGAALTVVGVSGIFVAGFLRRRQGGNDELDDNSESKLDNETQALTMNTMALPAGSATLVSTSVTSSTTSIQTSFALNSMSAANHSNSYRGSTNSAASEIMTMERRRGSSSVLSSEFSRTETSCTISVHSLIDPDVLPTLDSYECASSSDSDRSWTTENPSTSFQSWRSSDDGSLSFQI